MADNNPFKELAQVDCSEHVEQKGRFSYLSWPFAIGELLKRHPKATWEVKRFNGVPYLQTDLGYFVEVGVTVDEVERSQIHPVLNNQNKPIQQPTPFDINTSIQRALVKAIALHGLGLYIYAGEDLPEVEKVYLNEDQLNTIRNALGALDMGEETVCELARTSALEEIEQKRWPKLKEWIDHQLQFMAPETEGE